MSAKSSSFIPARLAASRNVLTEQTTVRPEVLVVLQRAIGGVSIRRSSSWILWNDPHELNHDVLRLVRRRVDPDLERSVIPRIIVQGSEGAGSETQVTPTPVYSATKNAASSPAFWFLAACL